MPTGVPIQSVPNQNFTVTLDGNLYEMTIRYTNGVMSVSIVLNGNDVIDNIHAAACAPIIPAQYLEDGDGNFMFLTANFQLPNWEQFNITQSLMFFSAAELAAYRAPPVPHVTAAFFNPIAPLPLRFAPQGYVEA